MIHTFYQLIQNWCKGIYLGYNILSPIYFLPWHFFATQNNIQVIMGGKERVKITNKIYEDEWHYWLLYSCLILFFKPHFNLFVLFVSIITHVQLWYIWGLNYWDIIGVHYGYSIRFLLTEISKRYKIYEIHFFLILKTRIQIL